MEKRASTRVDFVATASVTQDGRTITGEVENLSLKGMFLRTAEPVSAGPVDAAVDLTAGDRTEHLELKGKTVRFTDSGVGIQFAEMDMETFTHLKQVVSLNCGDPETVTAEFKAQVAETRSQE